MLVGFPVVLLLYYFLHFVVRSRRTENLMLLLASCYFYGLWDHRFLFLFMWIRTTVPRFRYDQLMDLGWKRMIPLSLAWLLLIAAMRLGVDEGWNRFEVVGIAVVAGTVAAGALAAAMRVAAARREEQGVEATF